MIPYKFKGASSTLNALGEIVLVLMNLLTDLLYSVNFVFVFFVQVIFITTRGYQKEKLPTPGQKVGGWVERVFTQKVILRKF